MAFKYLCQFERELKGDVLRQRRDVYALSLGLIIYHIAGGSLGTGGEFAAVHIMFDHPHRLYVIAILALVYFTYRYWIVAPTWRERFRQDFDEQWRVTKPYQALSKELIQEYGATNDVPEALKHVQRGWNVQILRTSNSSWAVTSLTLRPTSPRFQ